MSTLAIVLISVYVTALIGFFIIMKIGANAENAEVSDVVLFLISLVWPIWLSYYLYSLVRKHFNGY